MIKRMVSRLLTVLGLLTLCLGATSSSCSLNDGNGSSGSRPSFVADLSLRNSRNEIVETFSRGEPITMVLTIRNRLDTPASVEFSSARTSDFVVVREGSNNVVWQWSKNQTAFAQVATTLLFAAGETQTFTTVWNQRDNDGTLLRTGSYEARGALVYDNFDSKPLETNQMASTLKRFTTN